MKPYNVLFSVLILALLFSACNQKAKRAKEYHDNLLHSVQVVIDSSLEFGDAVQSHDKDRAVRAEKLYSSLVDKTINGINAAGNFEGDTSLKYFSLELLGFYRTSLDNDFTPFLKRADGSFSEEQSIAADSLYSKLTMTENNYWERFDWAEKKFSKQYELSKLDK